MLLIETIGDVLLQPLITGGEIMPNDAAAENILERLSDLKNCPEEALAAYQELEVDGKVYYFTPGGFLYRKDPGTEEVGGFFCGYLTDEVWYYRSAAR
jgi:hypothetical protein